VRAAHLLGAIATISNAPLTWRSHADECEPLALQHPSARRRGDREPQEAPMKLHSLAPAAFALAALLHSPALAGTANFDALTEGSPGFTFSNGGMTFSDLDTGFQAPAVFLIEDASVTLAGEPGFSPNNTLAFSAFATGPTAVYGTFSSFVITPSQAYSSIQMTVFLAADQQANALRLTAKLNGNVMDEWYFLIPISAVPLAMEIGLSTTLFDRIEVGVNEPGSGDWLYAMVDDIVVSGGPFAAGVPFCFGDGTFTDHTTPCPCGNNGAAGHGCANSFDASGAQLSATGDSAADTVVLRSEHMPATALTMFLQHTTPADFTFHDGVVCAGGSLIRLRGRPAVAGQATFPNSSFAQDSTTTLSQRGGVAPGQGVQRYYSTWYRNAASTFCPPGTANITNGWRVEW
jgi:hypothetical protein